MNKLLQRLIVVSVLTVAVPLFIVWASNTSRHYRGYAGTGTYQLISEKDTANSFSGSFMDSIRVVIQNNRHKEKEVVIQISPETSVRILPENEITKLDFIPVTEYVFVGTEVKRISK